MPCGVHVVTAYESIPSGIDEGSHICIKNLIKYLHMRSPFFWDVALCQGLISA